MKKYILLTVVLLCTRKGFSFDYIPSKEQLTNPILFNILLKGSFATSDEFAQFKNELNEVLDNKNEFLENFSPEGVKELKPIIEDEYSIRLISLHCASISKFKSQSCKECMKKSLEELFPEYIKK